MPSSNPSNDDELRHGRVFAVVRAYLDANKHQAGGQNGIAEGCNKTCKAPARKIYSKFRGVRKKSSSSSALHNLIYYAIFAVRYGMVKPHARKKNECI